MMLFPKKSFLNVALLLLSTVGMLVPVAESIPDGHLVGLNGLCSYSFLDPFKDSSYFSICMIDFLMGNAHRKNGACGVAFHLGHGCFTHQVHFLGF